MCTLLAAAFLTLSLTTHSAKAAVVDLHAHPFMKDGMGLMFSGTFNEPLKAHDWTARFDSMINAETMEASFPGVGLVVFSLYAHPVFTNLKDSIRKQLKAAHAFAATSKNWVIARDPDEALAAQKAGKGVIILGLEGAYGILEGEADLKEFIDEGGIRIVTFLHLTDDEFGGAAFLKGIRGIFTPVAWLTQLFNPMREEGIMINRNGLTDAGHAMAKALMARRVWVDLSHSSDEAQRRLIPLLTTGDRPLLYTHSMLRKYFGAERALASWQLLALRKSRGILGLMPSEEMVEGTAGVDAICPKACAGACTEGLFAFAAQFKELSKELGPRSVVLGTDLNGGVPHLKPTSRCAWMGDGLDQDGVWNISQLPRIENALVKLGLVGTADAAAWPAHFVGTWQRLWLAGEAGQ